MMSSGGLQECGRRTRKDVESKRLVEMIDMDIWKREVDMCKGMNRIGGRPSDWLIREKDIVKSHGVGRSGEGNRESEFGTGLFT